MYINNIDNVCLQIVRRSGSSSTRMIVVICRTDYSLQTVVIRLCRNFRDCFGGGLSFRITN